VKKNERSGTAKLIVKMPGPGALDVAKTDRVKGAHADVEAGGKEELRIEARGKAKRHLNRSGMARVRALVTYGPKDAKPNTKSKHIRLKKGL
jgi:hypothetical protein